MHFADHDATGTPASTGRLPTEIEFTPAMIEAGIRAPEGQLSRWGVHALDRRRSCSTDILSDARRLSARVKHRTHRRVLAHPKCRQEIGLLCQQSEARSDPPTD